MSKAPHTAKTNKSKAASSNSSEPSTQTSAQPSTQKGPVLAFTAHDHRWCKSSVMSTVESLCAERSVRLTPVRQRTLEILLEAHTAMGAYEILDKLAPDGFATKPPQVYRALQFLIEQGFSHKLERLNAYVACVTPGLCEQPCFMVCVECGRVAEQTLPIISKQLNAAAEQLGFSPSASVMEVSGVCGECPGKC